MNEQYHLGYLARRKRNTEWKKKRGGGLHTSRKEKEKSMGGIYIKQTILTKVLFLVMGKES